MALESVPGTAGPPIVGHTARLLVDPPEFYTRRYQKYGPVSRFTLIGKYSVLAVGPKEAEAVLGRNHRDFANGPAWTTWIGPFFDRGLMLLDFDEHAQHRQLLAQAFTRDRVDGYLEQMYAVLEQDLPAWAPGTTPRAQEFVRATTLRAGVRVFMGGGLGAEATAIERAFLACTGATGAILRFPVPGGRWARGLAGRRRLEELFRERIPVVRARGGSDLFAVLCRARTEDGAMFSDEDIVNHMIFLLMASYDPVAMNLLTMIRHLAENPDWQERCRRESLALGVDEPGQDELARLTSLDLVARESLRLVPPVYALPHTAVDDVDLLGFHIPRGSVVVVSPYLNHRLPEYWAEPERFDPDRFAPHRMEHTAHEYLWIPFGGGVHACIGTHFAFTQMKAVMHRLLRRSTWRLAPGHAPGITWRGLPRMRQGLPVRLG
ncbi:cytochrome P450 [Pseudonocardia eucalypti]|uniref:Cytochrome P450 n=1 Tax=Pseudonocardia eucalypti TaxID=648755 RepID=A0ABP9QFU5_9PSEU|nr:cytochrome P450 [Pseudonocardia eucalypti]